MNPFVPPFTWWSPGYPLDKYYERFPVNGEDGLTAAIVEAWFGSFEFPCRFSFFFMELIGAPGFGTFTCRVSDYLALPVSWIYPLKNPS